MTKLDNFFDKVFDEFNRDITDRIFLMIQNDSDLMADYLKLVSDSEVGKDTLNRKLGEKIKDEYNLDDREENKNPYSTLIKSYTEHK